jgi:hypothetical protein
MNSRESSRVASLTKKWHDNCGPEWTVDRIKSLDAYFRRRLTEPLSSVPIPTGWATKRTRKYPRRFKDDQIHKIFSSQKLNIALAMSFLRIVTSIKIDGSDPTQRQKDKFIDAALRPVPEQFVANIQRIATTYGKWSKRDLLDNKSPNNVMAKKFDYLRSISPILELTRPMMFQTVKPHKTAPAYDKRYILKNVSRSDSRVYDLSILYLDCDFSDLLRNNHEFISYCVTGIKGALLPIPSYGSSIFSLPIGTVSFIQEGSCKARVVCSPLLAIQAINEPLKQRCKSITSKYDQIVTKDHQKGRERLNEWLSDNQTVWSIDASSWTDRFPLVFQLEVLQHYVRAGLISQDMVDIFAVSASKRYYSEDLKGNVKYTQGQPQGLGPSFHVATLAHYELVRFLIARSSIHIPLDSFYLVGDDIIFNNEHLMDVYVKIMQAMRVQVNPQKSLVSSRFGEFAGALVYDNTILMRPKLSGNISPENIVSVFDIMSPHFGSSFHRGFDYDTDKDLFRILSLPDDFGGRRYALPRAHRHNLEHFAIQKSRMQKQLSFFLSINDEGFNRWYDQRYLIKTGILHSLELVTDQMTFSNEDHDPGKLSMIIDDKLKTFEASRLTPIQLMNGNDIYDKLLALQSDLKGCRNPKELKVYTENNSDYWNYNGYLINYDDIISKLSSSFRYETAILLTTDSFLDSILDDITVGLPIGSLIRRPREPIPKDFKPTQDAWAKYLVKDQDNPDHYKHKDELWLTQSTTQQDQQTQSLAIKENQQTQSLMIKEDQLPIMEKEPELKPESKPKEVESQKRQPMRIRR